MRHLLALVLLAGVATAAPVPKALKDKKGDADLIVGTWKPAQGRTEWFGFTTDGGMKAWNTGGANNPSPYQWAIDPTATPKWMTWGGSRDGKPQWECVYELDGDTLRIAYVSVGHPLPAEVGAGVQNGFFCDLRRDTPDK